MIYKLIKFNFPLAVINLINSFISGRTFIVDISGSKSKKIEMLAGLAQGTVLNPLLLTIFLSDFSILPNVELAYYADDIAIYAAGWKPITNTDN